MTTSTTAPFSVRRILRALGPGVTTGAADDDPSGVATYSIAGAQLGTSLLWTAWLTWPLMGAVQMMNARIGMVTGMGLAGAFRTKFPRWIVGVLSLALLVANVINIGSDLSGMGDAAEMLGAGSSRIYVIVFGVGIGLACIRLRYHQIASVLKWLALVLFAYVITAFILEPDWPTVMRASVTPSWPSGKVAWETLVAILGTTISPYLFYWQAGQEVEEKKAKGRRMLVQREGATSRELADRRIDVGVGTFFSNMVMFFIILATALTLHKAGITRISSTREAAEALRPLAGDFAYWLYTLGIVGVGLLAIPTLAGSASYAFAETFDWAYGLDQRLRKAGSFYAVFAFAILAGIALDFLSVNPIKALFWTAVINGVLAPFLLVGSLIIASDRKIMNGQTSSLLSRAVVGLTAALMFGAAIGMFVLQ
ncbi:NRAMP family divalent metal transporter [Cognatiluteimonas profundi]|uniref:NRAMP family divalent metal transporter n=1 Tax=Cognatiluteimonas profundi TaxID=2594501 RepID=UPI00131A96DE|nr:divalent metal cation transporter [Lysobacter profundi]